MTLLKLFSHFVVDLSVWKNSLSLLFQTQDAFRVEITETGNINIVYVNPNVIMRSTTVCRGKLVV